MTQEEKQLIIRDLCTKLPYGVKVEVCIKDKNIKSVDCVKYDTVGTYIRLMDDEKFSIKPYLRPLSSMTEEERKEYELLANHCIVTSIGFIHLEAAPLIDWLSKNKFDYCGLIPKGLALEATEGIYENK